MNIKTDFLPRVKEVRNADETFSYGGRKDFEKPDQGDVKTIEGKLPSPKRFRSRASENNSYT